MDPLKQFFFEQFEKKLNDQGCDVNLISRQFVFDANYLEYRTIKSGRIIGYHGMHLVEYLVNELISDQERKTIFPSPYELGSLSPLAIQDSRGEALSNYFVKEYGSDPTDIIKSIKRNICEWTGFKYQVYYSQEPSISTKVLCLLFRFRKKINLHLPTLLTRPIELKKSSHEFRSVYPILRSGRAFKISARNIAVIADLKANLTFEMGKNYYEMLYIIDELLVMKDCFLTVPFKRMAQGYRVNFKASKLFLEQQYPIGSKSSPERLDVEIYLYLSLLELEHSLFSFANVAEFINSENAFIHFATRPTRAAMKFLVNPETLYTPSDAISRAEYYSGKTLTCVSKEEASQLATAILSLVGNGLSSQSYTLLEFVAALMSLCGNEIKDLEYKIWWQGKTEIGSRPLSYLLSYSSNRHKLEELPGGYRDFWLQRYYRILHWFFNAEQCWRDSNELYTYSLKRIMEVIRTNDIANTINILKRRTIMPSRIYG